MKRLIILILIAAAAWQGYGKYQSRSHTNVEPEHMADVMQTSPPPAVLQEATPVSNNKCDGRIHCSQMNSCAEATFFLKNCPGVKMDGDNDGIPCEQQWCN